MKAVCILVVLFLVCFAACDEKPKNPIAVQGDRMIDAYHRSQEVRRPSRNMIPLSHIMKKASDKA